MLRRIVLISIIILSAHFGITRDMEDKIFSFPLNSLKNIELINVDAVMVEHRDMVALQVTAVKDGKQEKETLVLISGLSFSNGVIELEVAGEPAEGAFDQARGFIGLAFRVNKNEGYQYECFYLRPTNGRAEFQVQRNHSIQYVSHPEYPWYRMRQEFPEMYESYADLVPGQWTMLRIEVDGTRAKLFIDDADQPNLIVNDLKLGDSDGAVALWLHSSTLAHFRNLVVRPY